MPKKKTTAAELKVEVCCTGSDALTVEQLSPFQGAFKSLSDKNYKRFRTQLLETGIAAASTVWKFKGKNYLLDGHQRREALSRMQKEGIEIPKVPVNYTECKDETDARRKVLALASTYGEVSQDYLKQFAGMAEFDITDLVGRFTYPEIDFQDLIRSNDRNELAKNDDSVIKLPAKTNIKKGDLFKLGNHRLLCGDATVQADVVKLLGFQKPVLMVTDPPYGVEYDANWRNEMDRANGKPYGASSVGKVRNDHQVDWTLAYKLFPGQVVYAWHAGRHARAIQEHLEVAGFEMRCQIIWAKQNFAIGRGNYHWKHEPCWYAVRKGESGNWQGDRKQTTLWEIKSLNAFGGTKDGQKATGHSTQKPLDCMGRPIMNNSRKGEGIYDPFVGSGTTIIAAERLERMAFCMEIDPLYCELTINRWEAETGKKAEKVKP